MKVECVMDLFVGGEREVSTERAVAVVTKQNDARTLRSRVEHVQVRRMPTGMDRDTQLDVA